MAALGSIATEVLPVETFLAELKRIPFQRTTFFEGLRALLPFVGKAGEDAGEYFPVACSEEDDKNKQKGGDGDLSIMSLPFYGDEGAEEQAVDNKGQDWDGYFAGFVPKHKYFYLQGMLAQVLTAFVLNGFSPYPFVQSILMMVVVTAEFANIVVNAPYSSLASTREELIGKLGKVLVYVLVFLSFNRTAGLDVSFHLNFNATIGAGVELNNK